MTALDNTELDADLQRQNKFRRSGNLGFSLIEVIATLAILAILAAAILPVLIRQVDYANQGLERTNVVALSTGLMQGVAVHRYVPSQTDWATFIATNLGWQLSGVQTNFRNNPRVFLVDPNLVIGNKTASTLPYQQANTGAATITNARFMILSSQPGPLPAGLNSGIPSASDFNILWNNRDDAVPAGTSYGFNPNGQGSDLQIQRINLAPLFCRLTLTDQAITNRYAIDGVASTLFPSGTLDAYFLKGTVLSLYYWSNDVPLVQASLVLQQDSSWFFCEGLWRNAPCPNQLPLASLEGIVQGFYTNQPSTGTTPLRVYSDMTNYMALYYEDWRANFPKSGAIQNALQNAATLLGTDINDLISEKGASAAAP